MLCLVLFFHTKPRDWLGERLRNDRFCVEWDVKPLLNQSSWSVVVFVWMCSLHASSAVSAKTTSTSCLTALKYTSRTSTTSPITCQQLGLFIFVLLHFAWGEMNIGHRRLCVCVFMCLSAVCPWPQCRTNARTRMFLGGMVWVPSSCALFGGFAIGARISLLWQHSTEREMLASACTRSMPGLYFVELACLHSVPL